MILNTIKFDTSVPNRDTELLNKTISGTYSNSYIQKVRQYAFQSCQSLTGVNLPQCTLIGSRAFAACWSLTAALFPKVLSIDAYAFQSCYMLATVSFPSCTDIGNNVFINCRSLTTVSFPVCTVVGQYAFANCSSLTTVSFPACTSIGSGAFRQCPYLGAVYFYWTTTNSSIYSSAFYGCWRLKSLYLLGSQVKPLQNINVFNSTPISTYTTQLGTNGSIFVPSSLYASYRTATNWSTYAARFVSLTDAEVSAIKAQMGL